jgi:hypothetical protein
MRLRLSSRVEEGKTVQRVTLELAEDELRYMLGKAPPEHPRIAILCEHGLLRVRAGTDADPGYSMWVTKGRKAKTWAAQLNVGLFPNINWSHYQEITEVVVRRTNRDLTTMLTQLAEGESVPEPVIRSRAPRKAPAAKAQPERVRSREILPKEFVTSAEVLSPEEALAPQAVRNLQVTEQDRTMLRTAMDILNAQRKRGSIRLRLSEEGELVVDVVRIRVETESL